MKCINSKLYCYFIPAVLFGVLLGLASVHAGTTTTAVTLTVTTNELGALSRDFLGLSYESSMLLPKNGKYYFDAKDHALVNMFHTLGIKSLRVGANAVDDPRIPVPQEKDIDALFAFARAAGVKVIYSFRLKNGDPAESARLAAYIANHYADTLDCFAIGNEPQLYRRPYPPYEKFFAQWKPHYDAILRQVPDARFDGPSADAKYALRFASDFFGGGHLAMVSDHYYFLGSGRAAETNPAASRARFLSNHLHAAYQKDYAALGAILAAKGVPYRIDEMNSCYDGGARDSSDTYASTLWALDCTHWWAAHHILGVNFHTGESVGRDGHFGAPNYAAFLRRANGNGFTARPQAYGLLAFTEGAQGQPVEVKVQAKESFNINAYAYRAADNSIYVTLINKSYGGHGKIVRVTLQLPPGVNAAPGQRLDLIQEDNDVAAKTGVLLGGASIDAQGTWSGQWQTFKTSETGQATITVSSASAVLLRFSSL